MSDLFINGRKVVVEVISDEMADFWRKKTYQDRIHIMNRKWKSVRKMTIEAVKAQHPDWSRRQIQCEVAKRMSGDNIDKSIFDRILDESIPFNDTLDDE